MGKVINGVQARLDQGYGDQWIDLPKQGTFMSRGGTINKYPKTQGPLRQSRRDSHLVMNQTGHLGVAVWLTPGLLVDLCEPGPQ